MKTETAIAFAKRLAKQTGGGLTTEELRPIVAAEFTKALDPDFLTSIVSNVFRECSPSKLKENEYLVWCPDHETPVNGVVVVAKKPIIAAREGLECLWDHENGKGRAVDTEFFVKVRDWHYNELVFTGRHEVNIEHLISLVNPGDPDLPY